MWRLTGNSSLPIYLQIVDLIETKIMNGELLPEEKLPPERQLAEMFGVNRSTVVRALDELTARAVIIRNKVVEQRLMRKNGDFLRGSQPIGGII